MNTEDKNLNEMQKNAETEASKTETQKKTETTAQYTETGSKIIDAEIVESKDKMNDAAVEQAAEQTPADAADAIDAAATNAETSSETEQNANTGIEPTINWTFVHEHRETDDHSAAHDSQNAHTYAYAAGQSQQANCHQCHQQYEAEQETGKKKKRYTITKKGIALAACLCIVLSSVFGFGGALAANAIIDNYEAGQQGLQEDQGGSENDVTQKGDIELSGTSIDLSKLTGSEMMIREVIALNEHAVVGIRTELVATDSWMMQYITEGAGSGVIIDNKGYIITNNHVINEANKITVTLKNGNSYEATLVGADEDTDVAVIKIEATGLVAAVYGDSDEIMVGDLAVAIGNPLGELGGTATAGIISALDREITLDGKNMTLLQTDASINPGNSGGGLFNGKGQLVGVVVAKSTGSDVEGLGFAIPINTAKEVAEQLMEYGYVKGRPDAGMTFVDLTSVRNALMYGVGTPGIYIQDVYSQLAKSAGFQKGDMMYTVGETPITSANALTQALSKYKIGDKVKVTVVRGGRIIELTLTIGEKTN